MDKSEREVFYRWLDSANEKELQKKILAMELIAFRLTEIGRAHV